MLSRLVPESLGIVSRAVKTCFTSPLLTLTSPLLTLFSCLQPQRALEQMYPRSFKSVSRGSLADRLTLYSSSLVCLERLREDSFAHCFALYAVSFHIAFYMTKYGDLV